jgi:hypothetical protein
VCAAGEGKSGGAAASGANLFAPSYRKGVIMGCMLFVFQQFSGINAIVYFSSSVFKQVGSRKGWSRDAVLLVLHHLTCLMQLPIMAAATCMLQKAEAAPFASKFAPVSASFGIHQGVCILHG